MKMVSSFSLPGFIVLLLLISFPSLGSSQIDDVILDCPKTSVYSPNSTFASNLRVLLSSLSSNSTLGIRFYNSTFGWGTDIVYGSFLCQGDATVDMCQECVQTAKQEILKRCTNKQPAIIWYPRCMLRYSSRSFFFAMEASPEYYLLRKDNVSESERFNRLVTNSMDEIATQAASGNTSVPMFATGKVNFTRSQTLHTLAQCTSDISPSDCYKCLREDLPEGTCCSSIVEERFVRPSCNFRFQLYPLRAPPPPGGKGIKSMIVIIIIIPTLVAIVLVSFVYCLPRRNSWQKRNKNNGQEVQIHEFGIGTNNTELPRGNFQSGESIESQDFPSVPLSVLRLATENFSSKNKLGEGGFGPVYKGVLPNGKETAVKRLSRSSAQGIEEFKNEVILIAKLQHKNLVRLLGCCLEGIEMMLVYEYMPNASLDVFLFDLARRAQLDWKRRLSIIGGIARGLLYLHEDSRLRIIHRDLKPSNVLLDNEMNPKISDFGMARIFAEKQSQANTKRVVGTYGYMAPEYAMEGLFSVKSDVFSFGVILLEIISGRKNSGFHLSEHGRSLLLHAWNLWCEGKALEMMDPLVEKSCETSEVLKCIHIGLLCVQEDAEDRPTMSTVVVMLASDTISLPQPTQPAFSVGRVGAQMRQSSEISPMNCSINDVTLSNVEPR